MFTAAEVQGIIDLAFKKAESLIPNPWVDAGLAFAGKVIDSSPIPQLIADELNKLLGAKGVTAP